MHQPVLMDPQINEGTERGDVRHDTFENHAGLQILECAGGASGAKTATLRRKSWVLRAGVRARQVQRGQQRRVSSDGQFFRAGGFGREASSINAHYGDEPGVKFYTHLSDRYAPFHTKVIAATASEAAHVLDGLLYHQSEVATRRHHTDGGGDSWRGSRWFRRRLLAERRDRDGRP